MKRILFLFSALVVVYFSTSLMAQIPRVINYQGMLLASDEQPVAERDYKITFNLYDESDNLLWSEDHNNVFVGGGMFHVLLGTVTPLNLSFDQPYFLGIQVENDPELQPRMMMTSAAYSFNADKVGGISASMTPVPNTLYPLGSDGKFPASVLPDGSPGGNFLRKNEPDTSRGTSSGPLLIINNMGGGDGMRAVSANAIGLEGRSDTDDGLVGWTGGGTDKSGVVGSSTNGRGITGRSDNNDGLLGVSTSANAGHAGVHARNEGAGPAVYSEGHLFVTGGFRGNIGPNGGAPFPNPAYDSGWVSITTDKTLTLTHGIGGNAENYVVDMMFRYDAFGSSHIQNNGIGGDGYDNKYHGAYWSDLTNQQITVVRMAHDAYVSRVRIRIWVYQ